MNESQHTDTPQLDESQVMAVRREKLAEIRKHGVAFPNDFRRNAFAGDLQSQYGELSKEELEEKNVTVKVAGRMMLQRDMGKASFATLQDVSGQIQLYVNDQGVGEKIHEEFKHWDLGDILGAEGVLFKTNHGELTVRVSQIRLLAKALRPLPDKVHGLKDQETRYRQRYADLIVNAESREIFKKRGRIIQTIRNFMTGEQYLEVETPMMHPIAGGAAARPFVTHHNALDIPLFMRIAPELYLKRLVVGGFERVFEINRNFRNEGVSARHNPEFTMMEFYEAFSDYHRMMGMTEGVIRACANAVCGSLHVPYNGKEVDLEKRFDRLTIVDAIKKYNPHYTDEQLNDEEWLKKEVVKHGEDLPAAPGIGSLQLALFEGCAEGKLWNPTFIIDYPVEVSPLARASDTNPKLTERFELFAVGRELANGYSELNDPEDQADRFRSQVAQKEAGDDEAMNYDADYIRAMEYGLPPTGGCGIGIDRLVMLLTNAPSIRDVILFPHMRPEEGQN